MCRQLTACLAPGLLVYRPQFLHGKPRPCLCSGRLTIRHGITNRQWLVSLKAQPARFPVARPNNSFKPTPLRGAA